MAWSEQWSIKVDTHEVNDQPSGGAYLTYVPEVGWTPEYSLVMHERDVDHPVAVALRKSSGRLTFMIQMTPCDWATWETRYQQLLGWFAIGAHTFTFQIRGMAAAKSVGGIVTSVQSAPKERRVVVAVTVPNFVLA